MHIGESSVRVADFIVKKLRELGYGEVNNIGLSEEELSKEELKNKEYNNETQTGEEHTKEGLTNTESGNVLGKEEA